MGVARTLLIATAGCRETEALCQLYGSLVGAAAPRHKGTLCVFVEDEEGAESPVIVLAGSMDSVPSAVDWSSVAAGGATVASVLFDFKLPERRFPLPNVLSVYHTSDQAERAQAVVAAARSMAVIVECSALIYDHMRSDSVMQRELGVVAFGGALFASMVHTEMLSCASWAVSKLSVDLDHGSICREAAQAVCIPGVSLSGTAPGAYLISDVHSAARLLVHTADGNALVTPSFSDCATSEDPAANEGIAGEVRALALDSHVGSDVARLLGLAMPCNAPGTPVLIAQPQNAPLHSLYRALLAMDGLNLESGDARLERLGALVAMLVRDACRNEARLFPSATDFPALRRRLVTGAINELKALPLRSDALRSALHKHLAAFRFAPESSAESAAPTVHAQFVPLVPYLEVSQRAPRDAPQHLIKLAKRTRSVPPANAAIGLSLLSVNSVIAADNEERRSRGREYWSVPFGPAP